MSRAVSVRKVLFWSHLVTGAVAAVGVLLMAATGVVLTYDRQIRDWSAHLLYEPASESPRLSVDAMLDAVAPLAPTRITIPADLNRMPVVSKGRRTRYYVDPYTGEMLGSGNEAVNSFLSSTLDLHRWLALNGEARDAGRAFTGASNLLFLFLLLSGVYLWLPPLMRWVQLRPRIWFRSAYASAKARDYHWHHVLGAWALVPLFAIVASGVVLSYGWAGDLVRWLVSEEAVEYQAVEAQVLQERAPLPLQDLYEEAARTSPGWRRIEINVPDAADGNVKLHVDYGSGGEPTKKRTLTMHRGSAETLHVENYSDLTASRRARIFLRYLHTGEVLGVAGQTIAGAASLLALLMVWTGLALAWRRYRSFRARPRE